MVVGASHRNTGPYPIAIIKYAHLLAVRWSAQLKEHVERRLFIVVWCPHEAEDVQVWKLATHEWSRLRQKDKLRATWETLSK